MVDGPDQLAGEADRRGKGDPEYPRARLAFDRNEFGPVGFPSFLETLEPL